MRTQPLFRWEQDGQGGEHGTATYFFPGTPCEITVSMASFKDAQALSNCITAAIEHTRWDARAGLLAEISRIKP